jgi:hypothetical protein
MVPEMTIPIVLAKYVPQNLAAFPWSAGITKAAAVQVTPCELSVTDC